MRSRLSVSGDAVALREYDEKVLHSGEEGTRIASSSRVPSGFIGGPRNEEGLDTQPTPAAPLAVGPPVQLGLPKAPGLLMSPS